MHRFKYLFTSIGLRVQNKKIPTWYVLQKFGLNPGSLIHRLFPQKDWPRVLLICIPKSGTNLLERAVCLHPFFYRKFLPVITLDHLQKQNNVGMLLQRTKPGQVLVSHLTYTPERAAEVASSGVKTIMMIRDPRDIVVSRVFFATHFRGHQYEDVFKAQPDLKSKIQLSIIGDENAGVNPIRQHLEQFAGWLDVADYVVRFEDLIGSRGGGSDALQEKTIKGMFQAVGVKQTHLFLENILHNLYSSSSPTFHKGLIGQWHENFDHELEVLFMNQAGDLLKQFGYI